MANSTAHIAKQNETDRLLALDLIKCLGIIMVIITHVADVPQPVRRAILWPHTILPAVPLFLMSSVYAFSLAEDRGGQDVFDWFERKRFKRRFGRILWAWLFAIAVEIALLFVICGAKRIGFWSIVKILSIGGRGPGSYYVQFLFQLLALFPFMKYAFDRKPYQAAITFVMLQVAWEFLCEYNAIDPTAYNRILLRQLSTLVLGFLAYRYFEKIKNTAIPLVAMLVGGVLLVSSYYLGYAQVLPMTQGNRTLFAALYSFGLFVYLLRLEPFLQRHAKGLRPVFAIGKASYHIMLTQMVYFYFARRTDFEMRIPSLPLRIAFDLVISILSGFLFYRAEMKMRKILQKRGS